MYVSVYRFLFVFLEDFFVEEGGWDGNDGGTVSEVASHVDE